MVVSSGPATELNLRGSFIWCPSARRADVREHYRRVSPRVNAGRRGARHCRQERRNSALLRRRSGCDGPVGGFLSPVGAAGLARRAAAGLHRRVLRVDTGATGRTAAGQHLSSVRRASTRGERAPTSGHPINRRPAGTVGRRAAGRSPGTRAAAGRPRGGETGCRADGAVRRVERAGRPRGMRPLRGGLASSRRRAPVRRRRPAPLVGHPRGGITAVPRARDVRAVPGNENDARQQC